MASTLARLPTLSRRKVGMTSNPHGPYAQGYTRATMAGTTGSNTARWRKPLKAGPRSDRGVKLAHVKADALVVANQQLAVNTVPVREHTARPTTNARDNRN